MGFLDKAKAAAEQAAAKAKEGVEDVQLKRDLGQAYGDLGRIVFGLVESGEVSHSALEAPVAKIRGLNEKAAASDGEPVGAATGASESYDSDQPPAMPT
jgi:hypothetical protein